MSSVFVKHFVYCFDITDEGRVVMVSAGEVHILLFEICFSDFEPTVVFFQPLYALFQSGRMASIIPMVTIILYVADLFVNKSLPVPVSLGSDYTKINAEFS